MKMVQVSMCMNVDIKIKDEKRQKFNYLCHIKKPCKNGCNFELTFEFIGIFVISIFVMFTFIYF